MSNFDGCIFLQRVRLSFPNIVTPRAPQGSDKLKYSADFILQPNDPNYAKFVTLAYQKVQEKLPKIHTQVIQTINAERKRRCYGNGSERVNAEYKILDGYDGMVYLSASRQADKGMPQLINAANQGIDPNNTLECQNEARRLYGGCYVNAVIKPWFYDNQWGKGISADFVAIQFCADGEAFGEGVTDASALFAGAQATQAPGLPPMPFPGVQAPPMGAPQFPPVAAPLSPWG